MGACYTPSTLARIGGGGEKGCPDGLDTYSLKYDLRQPHTHPRQSSRRELCPSKFKARLALCAVWVVVESWSPELCQLHLEMRGGYGSITMSLNQ